MITVCLVILDMGEWFNRGSSLYFMSGGDTVCVCYMCQVGGVVSPPLRRSPLNRQPVLTHHHRRQVVVTKSVPLSVNSKVTRSTDVTKRMSDTDRDRAARKLSMLEEHDQTDADADTLSIENASQDLASESAVFIPGRLLGTSDSFCVKSFRDVPRRCHTNHLQMSVDQSASCGGFSADITGSHGDGDHGDTSADDSADAFDEEPSDIVTVPPAAIFVRDTHHRHLRRPVAYHTSE